MPKLARDSRNARKPKMSPGVAAAGVFEHIGTLEFQMSLSPRKSPPMRKAWRDVAKRVPEGGLDIEEHSGSICAALFEDLRIDVGEDALKAIHEALLRAERRKLSPDQSCAEIEAMREAFPATGFLDAIIECVQLSLHFGKTGESAFIQGVGRAGLIQASASNRAVEEWRLRAGKAPLGLERSIRARQNLDGALKAGRMRGFGSEVMQRVRGRLDAGPEIG